MENNQSRIRTGARTKVLDGAMLALGKRGMSKVSIDDICAEAGVSKRTLYRHFQGRSEIIAAIADHISEEFATGLGKAIAATPAIDKRLGLVAGYLVDYAMSSDTAKLNQSEAEFVRASLRKNYQIYRNLVRAALDPIFADRDDLIKAGFTANELSDFVFRMAVDALLMPDYADHAIANTIVQYWRVIDISVRFSGEISRLSIDR